MNRARLSSHPAERMVQRAREARSRPSGFDDQARTARAACRVEAPHHGGEQFGGTGEVVQRMLRHAELAAQRRKGRGIAGSRPDGARSGTSFKDTWIRAAAVRLQARDDARAAASDWCPCARDVPTTGTSTPRRTMFCSAEDLLNAVAGDDADHQHRNAGPASSSALPSQLLRRTCGAGTVRRAQ